MQQSANVTYFRHYFGDAGQVDDGSDQGTATIPMIMMAYSEKIQVVTCQLLSHYLPVSTAAY